MNHELVENRLKYVTIQIVWDEKTNRDPTGVGVNVRDSKLLMLNECCIFVCIKIKTLWLPLILKGKSTDKALVCSY